MSSRDLSRTAQSTGLGFLENEEAFDRLEKELLEEPHTILAGGQDCTQEKADLLKHLGGLKDSVKGVGDAVIRMKRKMSDAKVIDAIDRFFERLEASVNRLLDRVKTGVIKTWQWASKTFDQLVDFTTNFCNSIF